MMAIDDAAFLFMFACFSIGFSSTASTGVLKTEERTTLGALPTRWFMEQSSVICSVHSSLPLLYNGSL